MKLSTQLHLVHGSRTPRKSSRRGAYLRKHRVNLPSPYLTLPLPIECKKLTKRRQIKKQSICNIATLHLHVFKWNFFTPRRLSIFWRCATKLQVHSYSTLRWESDRERGMGKDLEEDGPDLLEDITPPFAWVDWGESQMMTANSPAEIRTVLYPWSINTTISASVRICCRFCTLPPVGVRLLRHVFLDFREACC